MSNATIKRKLDLIAKHVNEANSLLRAHYGEQAYLYFEAEGRVYAMQGEATFSGRHESAGQRQERISESSKPCQFDCGAW